MQFKRTDHRNVVREKVFKGLGYVMQMLTLLVIFESVVFHEEISCETRTLYSMNQVHLIINSSNCIYFLKKSIWQTVSGCTIQK